MLDDHKIVYVVSFMPSFEGSVVGGFNWYIDEDAARRALMVHMQVDAGTAWSHDYTIRSVPVPYDLDANGITALLDSQEGCDWRELPLPPEWESIRGEGGSREVGDEA